MVDNARQVQLSVQNGQTRRRFIQAAGVAGVVTVTGCVGGDDEDTAPEEGVAEDPDGEEVPTVAYENLDPDSPLRYWYGEEHAGYMEELGLEVDYNSRALDAHLERVFDTRDFDCAPMRYLDGYDPDALLRAFSQAALGEGGDNTSGHDSEEYEEWMAEQREAVDEDDRQEIVHEMYEYLMEEQVISPIAVQDRAMPYNEDRVSNVQEVLEDGLASIWNMVNLELDGGAEGDDMLTIASHEELPTLNPVTGLEARSSRDMIRLIYDRLMHPDPDNDYMPSSWAAEEFGWADDTTYEITLREGMEWHDGEPVTAEDVAFTFEYSDENSPDFQAVATNFESAEAETDLDVTFELSQPDATWESEVLAGAEAHLIPQHVWEGEDPSEIDIDEDLIGSGPFQFEAFEPGEEVRLSRHDGHHHEPNVEELIRLESADASSSASLVTTGEVDLVNFDLPADQLVDLEDEDGIALQNANMTSLHYITWNQRREPFANIDLRQACAHTIPRDDIVDVGADGFAEVTHAPVAPDLEFWYTEDVPTFEFDIEAGQQVLLDAGFEWHADTGRLHYPADYDPVD
ncbi:hypothetical protein G6M89_15350 [Natronolimnobius sp. AArcel1]|uniref:ABC transporter substrate-binding protein n=1 Tax=Natronolimnobius sp. AArcel1 TaxID=1679093 RepID=UPI0013EDC709|nr:ABC transporter substrate-binding protein [Natronolimnobius sp. AArcel1]NGM70365.1 hypothetical protein [Natronolimnobius sp. AArcel1]